jgi:hypothetical protein
MGGKVRLTAKTQKEFIRRPGFDPAETYLKQKLSQGAAIENSHMVIKIIVLPTKQRRQKLRQTDTLRIFAYEPRKVWHGNSQKPTRRDDAIKVGQYGRDLRVRKMLKNM